MVLIYGWWLKGYNSPAACFASRSVDGMDLMRTNVFDELRKMINDLHLNGDRSRLLYLARRIYDAGHNQNGDYVRFRSLIKHLISNQGVPTGRVDEFVELLIDAREAYGYEVPKIRETVCRIDPPSAVNALKRLRSMADRGLISDQAAEDLARRVIAMSRGACSGLMDVDKFHRFVSQWATILYGGSQ